MQGDRKKIANILYRILFSVILASALSACGGGNVSSTTEGNSGDNVPVTPVDTTAPTVTVSPADTSTGIARNTTLTATFDEDMFASTISTSSFTLSDGSSVSGTVSYDTSTKIATFTPASTLGILTSYTANLTTSITDLAGNALAATNWSFTTVDGSWGTAALIETDDTDNAITPQIAFSSNGNAIAVWAQSDGVRTNIWANLYSSGSGWGTAELIETDNGGNATVPQIAMDSSGNGIAVWAYHDGTRTNIHSNYYTSGSGWGTAAAIEASGNEASAPQIAMDTSGNGIAVFHQVAGPRTNIYANYYTSGGTWGGAVAIDTDNGNAVDAQVAFDGSGNAVAVWSQTDGTQFDIKSNTYTSGVGWGGAAVFVESDNAGDATKPQIAMNSSGNAVAVWIHNDATRDNIMANTYSSSTWGTAGLIETDNAGAAASPQVAIDSNGNAIAIWHHSDGTRNNIMANTYTSSAWGTAGTIETDNTGDATNPHVSFDSKGNAMAIWSQSDGTRTNITVNRYTSSTWATPSLIETDNSGDATVPQIAIDSNGFVQAVWAQSDATRTNIWSNRFD